MKRLLSILIALALFGGASYFIFQSQLTQVPKSAGALSVGVAQGERKSVEDSAALVQFLAAVGGGRPAPFTEGGKTVCTFESDGNMFTVEESENGYLVSGNRIPVLIEKDALSAFSREYGGLFAPQTPELSLSILQEEKEVLALSPASGSLGVLGVDGSIQTQALPDEPSGAETTLLPGEGVLRFSSPPTKAILSLKGPGGEIASEETAPGEFHFTLEDGPALLTLTAAWDSPLFSAAAEYRAELLVDLPDAFRISPERVAPGEFVWLLAPHATNADSISVVQPFKGKANFFMTDQGAASLLPVGYNQKPGIYTITFSDGTRTKSLNLEVVAKDFPVDRLTIDDSVASETVQSKAANAEYNTKVEPLKSGADPNIYWEGNFVQPVEGRITTEFGLMRYTNDDPTPSRHGGIDIAAKQGTPIVASNSGKVVFSEYIALTGNTIMIEHGMGLKTWYYHMDSRAAQTGETVKKGQVIGTVGTTGYSTGPHLHFAASVGSIYVNPWTLIKTDPLDER